MNDQRRVPKARDALGLPVPPSWLAAVALRLRGGLGQVHSRMVPPFNFVLERLFGLVDTKALYCAVDLGIPELLAERARTAAEIAAQTNSDPDAVVRLMRFLVMRGFFKRKGDTYSNNAASDALRADHPYSFRDWVVFFGSSWSLEIWNRMPQRVRTGQPATEAAFDTSFFEYLHTNNPAAGRAFDGAMAAGSRIQALVFAEKVDLSGVRHLCDVGGGSGSVVAHLLRVSPSMRGTVFDLPALAEEAGRVLQQAGLGDRAAFGGGNFFEAVPEGCDLYTLFSVVHDWDNERCIKILTNVRQAMAAGGRIMVVEGVLSEDDRDEFAKTSDMLMLVFGDQARERTMPEFDHLWAAAGLQREQVIDLAGVFKVFVLRA